MMGYNALRCPLMYVTIHLSGGSYKYVFIKIIIVLMTKQLTKQKQNEAVGLQNIRLLIGSYTKEFK